MLKVRNISGQQGKAIGNSSGVAINDLPFAAGEFIEFDRENGTIAITNTADTPADILSFGGEKYTEHVQWQR